MPPEITRLVSQFLKDPERIEAAPPATTAKTITQRFMFCPNGEDWAKRETLRQLIASQNVKNAIIFCNRKVEVAILHKSLVKHGFSAGALHGDMDQKARTETLDKFRAGELMLLAASDVAARGLDIPDVSHIFNFDLPWQPDDYVHRIGRTGRAGKEGMSTSLVTLDELKSLKDIEKMLGEPVVWLGDAPSAEDFAEGGKKRRGRGGRAGAQRGRGRGPAPSARGGDKGRRDEHRVHGRAPEQRAEGRSERPERAAEPRRQDAGRPEATAQRPHTQQPQEPRAAGSASSAAPAPGAASARATAPGAAAAGVPAPRGPETRTQTGVSRRAQAAAASPSRSRQRPWPSAPSRASAAAAARSRRRPAAAGTRGLCRQHPGLPAQARQAPGQGRERVAAASGLG